MQNIYTVAQINSYIKNMFTQDYMLQSVLVKGEVSNCKYHSSGHIYFTLKEANTSCMPDRYSWTVPVRFTSGTRG